MTNTDKEKDSEKSGISRQQASCWNAGFAFMTITLIAIFGYSLFIRDMTLYQIAILAISIYTMGTMGICIFLPYRKHNLSDKRPYISILVPAKNEELVIENTVRSLFEIDYKNEDGSPNFEVLIIDDNSDDGTLEVLKRLKEEYPALRPIHRESGRKGKSAVLNYAVPMAKGELIAVFDADTIVEKDFFEKTVKHFNADNIAGVQGRVKIFNRNANVLTKLQDDEFTVFAHMLQVSKSIFGGIMQLAGNGQIVRKDALMEAGGWNELSSTDDQDLTIKLLLNGKLVNYVPEAAIWQEAIKKPYQLLRQRIRWAEGMLKCIFDYIFPVLTHKKLSLLQKIDGLAGIMRIAATIVVWIGYIQLFTIYFCPTLTYYSSEPLAVFCNTGMLIIFIVVMLGGLLKYHEKFSFVDLLRFPLYWIYNIIWLIAAPIGYINSIRYRNKIVWDKTEHNVKDASIPPASK